MVHSIQQKYSTNDLSNSIRGYNNWTTKNVLLVYRGVDENK